MFFSSFKFAIRGLIYVFKHERSFRLQCLVAVLVIFGTWFFNLAVWETILILLLVASVLTLEVLNSAFEVVLDVFKPRLYEHAGVAKDCMAGAVLLASLFSFFIGVYLFLPHILELLRTF
jgi:diacylglycerol kinase